MSDYESYWKKRGSSGFRPRYKIFSNWIEPGLSVLDIGCGDGRLGAYLVEQKNISYLGADISHEALAIARGRGLAVRQLDASTGISVFSPQSFDYVIMSEFIEHVIHSEELIRQAMTIARKAVLISIPNSAYWRYRLQLLCGNFPKQWAVMPHEHVRFWSIDDFYTTIKSLGFKMKDIKSSNGKEYLRDLWPNLFGFQICYYITR